MRPVHDMVGALDLLYRAFYRAVLARLPERGAVAMGQWGLRHLPLDRLGMFRNLDPRLATTLGGVRLANPLILSSHNPRRFWGGPAGPAELKDVSRAARAAPANPLIVKISPDFRETNEEITIPAALDAGITIVNYGNPRRVDEPRLSQRTGGLSGPALFATTLENVGRVRERFGDRLELIATGGIDSPDSARRALHARAAA